MRFQPIFDIWGIPGPMRRHIQPGQMVYAGSPDHRGRFMGSTGQTDVVAWVKNARAHRRQPDGVNGYNRTLRNYAKGLGA